MRRECFFDTREKHPAIVINSLKNDRNRFFPRLYAKVVYNTSTDICISLKLWKRSGQYKFPIVDDGVPFHYVNYLWRIEDYIYPEVPHHLHVTTDKKCKKGLSDSIKVLHNNGDTKILMFGACLHQPLFGNVNTQEVIDWIIIHELLGAEIIYIYLETSTISEKLVQSLKSFTSKSVLEIIDWSLGIKTANYGQRAVINDCLYRSMNKVEFLALYDLDEILVPRNHLTWPELIAEIKAKVDISQFASLKFDVRQWHDDGIALVNTTSTNASAIPIYLRRTQIVETAFYYKSPGKSMVRPNFINIGPVHGVKQARSKKIEYVVPQDVAIVNHYRKRERPLVSSRYDSIMEKYVDQIMTRRNKINHKQ